MALLHEGAAEGGRSLLAFFSGNPLVEQVNGKAKMEEVTPIDYQEEIEMIKYNLSKSGRQIRFVSSPATFREVQSRLIMGCQILHFTGHGSGEYLGFEANDAMCCGVLERLTVDGLKELFEAGQPELVFFGSCRSEAHGNALAEAGVPHVVAVRSQDKVEDETARIFSSAFYHALIAGNHPVKGAFDIAVSAVRNKKPQAVEKFLLLPENDDHDVSMFDDLPKGTFRDETPPLPIAHRLPSARKTYFGAVGLQHAVSLLQNPDAACVSIVGEAEIGKTERALQATHYTRERQNFNAIFFADFKQVISQRLSPPPQASRPEAERFYKRHFCELIAMALGLNTELIISPQKLWDFLFHFAINETGQAPFKTLLILDGVDALYEDRGEEARTSLVKVLDDLCRISPNLKLLLTCKEELLKNTDERLSNTKELVHKVHPLEGKDPALLLWHLSPRDSGCGLYYEDIDAKKGCSYDDVVERLQNLDWMKIVNGHPGTLCHLGPLLQSSFMNASSMAKYAERYRTQLKTRREPFSEIRASDIASSAGLKDIWCKLVWVGATSRAEAEGRRVKGLQDDAHYRSVLWRYISLGLEKWLCRLQTTGDNEEQLVDDNQSVWHEGSGRTYSSGNCYYSGAGWGTRGQDMGHGYTSTLKPRKFSKEELKFVKHVLWLSRSRSVRHVPSAKHVNEGGHRNEAGGDAKAGDAEEKGHLRSVSEDNEDVVTLEKFVNFCKRWWIPVMTTLSRILKEWTPMKPMKVCGFISRHEAECRLESIGQPGVFLLRFSESRPGRLILTFTSEAMNSDVSIFIQHSLVTVQPDGQWTLHYDDNTSHGISYPSLRDLVLDRGVLKVLYPRDEKRRAFET